MKKLRAIPICLLIAAVITTGCQPSRAKGPAKPGKSFPRSLAGTWQADASYWQVTLAPDGNVVSVIDGSGVKMIMAEGGFYKAGTAEGSFLYNVYGPSFAVYNPAARQLDATITIDDFHMEFQGGVVLEGNFKFFLTGPVSADSKKWDVRLFTYGALKGGAPSKPIRSSRSFLFFTKLKTINRAWQSINNHNI